MSDFGLGARNSPPPLCRRTEQAPRREIQLPIIPVTQDSPRNFKHGGRAACSHLFLPPDHYNVGRTNSNRTFRCSSETADW